METLWQDLKFGARMLLKQPGFTAVAVLTLALGIGANTAIFSWVQFFLLRGFPGVPNTSRTVIPAFQGRAGVTTSFSYPDYLDYRDRNSTLSGLIVSDMQPLSLSREGTSERVWGMLVSGNYFDALEVRPVCGRGFLPDEDKVPLAKPVAVISYGLWQRRFAGDPDIVGKSITLNNHSFTVVGVAPADFHGSFVGLQFDIWVPMMMQEWIRPAKGVLTARGNHWLDGVARLKPGVSREQAQADLNVIAKQLEKEFPNTNAGYSVVLFPLWRAPYGAVKVMSPVLMILSGLVAVVLLIACANVANLLLARASARRKEIAVRLSLGAGRGRLIRQLLTESVLLSLLGGVLGILIAFWSFDLLLAFLPTIDVPVDLTDQSLSGNVLLFTTVLSLLTGLIFGLAPALGASRADVVTALKDESGTLGAGSSKSRLRNSLVVGQVALSLLLLICAGLLLRSLQNAESINPGFNPRNVLLATLDMYPSGYSPETGRQFYARVLERVAALPGVESVSLARRVPLGFGGSSSTSFEPEGYQPQKDEFIWAFYNNTSPGYFQTMQVPILKGRDFSERDADAAPRAVVINDALATRYWPGLDPIGKRIRLGGEWLTVIGVVGNFKVRGLNEEPWPALFLSLLQYYRPDTTLHVRTKGDPAAFTPDLRAAVQTLDSNLPLSSVRTLEDHTGAATFVNRLGGSMLGVFGGLALLLAAVGVYGVVSFGVSQRTREIGIRIALGASRRDIFRLVVGQGTRLALIGISAGLALALGVTHFLEKVLFNVSARDPLTIAGVMVLLAAAALLACYLPARRAAKVDPMVALRYE